MTRDEKAAERAESRAQRRRPPEPEAQPERDAASEPPQQARPPAPEPRRGAPLEEVPRIAARARELLRSLRGVDAESVSALSRTPRGWRVTLEAVELRRIPETTDVLASYDVELDEDGNVIGFERGRRYTRSRAEGAVR